MRPGEGDCQVVDALEVNVLDFGVLDVKGINGTSMEREEPSLCIHKTDISA